MKIIDKITLIATDVFIGNPPYGFFPGEGRLSDGKMFKCIGVIGSWNSIEKGWRCPSLLNPLFGWSNLLELTGMNYSYQYQYLEDAIFSDSSFEEVILDLQLSGYRNVFKIPPRLLRELENKAEQKQGHMYATHFTLSFKDLKSKCKRLL